MWESENKMSNNYKEKSNIDIHNVDPLYEQQQ